MNQPCLLIINPKHAASKKWKVLSKALVRQGQIFETAISRNADDLTWLTRKGLDEGYRSIVPLGGDGTLSLCARGFMEDGVNLFPESSIIPTNAGTGNDFFCGLIPKEHQRMENWDFGRLQDRLVSLGVFRDEMGLVGYFLNSFSCGITADILKRRSSSYLISTVQSLFHYRAEDLCMRMPLQTKRETLLFMICKGAYVGGGMRFHPDADHLTSTTKAVWIPKLKALDIARNFLKIYQSGVAAVSAVESFDVEKVQLVFSKPQSEIEADGEVYTVGQSLKIEIVPQAIRIRTP